MKLKVKSLQGSTFTIDASSSDTISNVKSKIESLHGHQAASQKIIYSGKILTDTETVQSCGVSEKDFLVLMVSKPKAPKAAAAAPTPAAAPVAAPLANVAAPTAAPSSSSDTTMSTDAVPAAAAAASPPAPQAPAITPSIADTNASAGAAAPETSGPPGTSQFLVGSVLEEAVNNIVEMGFEKSEVQKAMRASFNNPERAVEYLMTGIPEHLTQPAAAPATARDPLAPSATAQAGQSAAAPTPTSQTSAPAPQAAAVPSAPAQTATRSGNLFEAAAAQAQGGGAHGATGGAGALSGLQGMEDDGSGRSVLDLGNPAMIAQLRQLVQQNPAALNPLVQALAQSNPRLAEAMAQDPEAVLNLLESGDAQGEGDQEAIEIPGMDELNPEDRMAVEQIIAMGIPEPKAIEAYLMCGRNVEMAVQYYFENPGDFDN